jgi:hypothetical protein
MFANEAERHVRNITALAPVGSDVARQTDNVVIGVRGWFSGAHALPHGLQERKIELLAMISALERAAAQYDKGDPR